MRPNYANVRTGRNACRALEASGSRINILRSEFNRLIAAGNSDRQAPFEVLFSGRDSVQPPIALAHHHRGLPLFIQPGCYWTASLHALTKEVIKTFASATFREIFVSHSDDVDGIYFDGDVQRLHSRRWPQNDLQVSFAADGLGTVCGPIR